MYNQVVLKATDELVHPPSPRFLVTPLSRRVSEIYYSTVILLAAFRSDIARFVLTQILLAAFRSDIARFVLTQRVVESASYSFYSN